MEYKQKGQYISATEKTEEALHSSGSSLAFYSAVKVGAVKEGLLLQPESQNEANTLVGL